MDQTKASDKLQVTTEELTAQPITSAPVIYANAFLIGISNADVVVDLRISSMPVGKVFMSYTLAKTLHQKLGTIVADIERRLEMTLPTTDDIAKAFQKVEETKNEETK